jgi:CubicO group peptidase (beta-lactamase class C family)
VTDQRQLAARFSELLARHRVPGGQLVVCRGGRSTSVHAGERRAGQPMTEHTPVPVGSVTKVCTAAMALTLVADGDLGLDDPLGDHLPELRAGSRGLAGQVTLRQALSHTSGLPGSLGELDNTATSARRYAAECARHAAPVCPPGTGFSYSNVGYALVGRLIEVVTGQSWAEAVDAVLLRPLGVRPTFLADPDPAGDTASGHSATADGRFREVAQTTPVALAAAGGLALSATDLAAVGRALLAPDAPGAVDLLDPAALAELHRPVPHAEPFGLADGWGLGLAVFGDGRWTGHDGTADGTSCHLRVDRRSGDVVALTTNCATGVELWEELIDVLSKLGIPVSSYRLPLSATAITPPEDCFGDYVNGPVEYSVAARADGQPYVAVGGEVYPELTVDERWAFSVRDPRSGRRLPGGRFLRDPRTGRINGLLSGGRLARRRAAVS